MNRRLIAILSVSITSVVLICICLLIIFFGSNKDSEKSQPVSNLSVLETNKGISVNYKPSNSLISGYRISKNENVVKTFNGINNTSYLDTDVKMDNKYSYSVEALYDGANSSKESAEIVIYNKLPSITNFKAYATSESTINLTWNLPSSTTDLEGYTICAKLDDIICRTISTPLATGYEWDSLETGTKYTFYITPDYNGYKEVPISTTVGTTQSANHPPPSNVNSTLTACKDIRINWTPPTNSLSLKCYKIYETSNPGLEKVVDASLSYVDFTNLNSGTYNFQVEASYTDNHYSIPIETTISIPTYSISNNFTGSVENNNDILLKWDIPTNSDLEEFYIYYGTGINGEFSTKTVVDKLSKSYTFTNLQSGIYRFKLEAAYTARKCTAISTNIVTLVIKSVTPELHPLASLYTYETATSSGNVTLHITPPYQPTLSYTYKIKQVDLSEINTPDKFYVVNSNQLLLNVTGLTPGNKYSFLLYVDYSDAVSEESNAVVITVPTSTYSADIFEELLYYEDTHFIRFYLKNPSDFNSLLVIINGKENEGTTYSGEQINDTKIILNKDDSVKVVGTLKSGGTKIKNIVFGSYEIPPEPTNSNSLLGSHRRLRFYNMRNEDIWVQFNPGSYNYGLNEPADTKNFNCVEYVGDQQNIPGNNKYKVLESDDTKCVGFVKDHYQQATNESDSFVEGRKNLYTRFGDRKTNIGFATQKNGDIVLDQQVVQIKQISTNGKISFHDYFVSDGGMVSTNFHIRTGCDQASGETYFPMGMNCRIGDSNNYSILYKNSLPTTSTPYYNIGDAVNDTPSTSRQVTKTSPAINTLVEATFGCLYENDDRCNINPSSVAYTSTDAYLNLIDTNSYIDISAVDGYTIPMILKIRNMVVQSDGDDYESFTEENSASEDLRTCYMGKRLSGKTLNGVQYTDTLFDGIYDCSNLKVGNSADGTTFECPAYNFNYVLKRGSGWDNENIVSSLLSDKDTAQDSLYAFSNFTDTSVINYLTYEYNKVYPESPITDQNSSEFDPTKNNIGTQVVGDYRFGWWNIQTDENNKNSNAGITYIINGFIPSGITKNNKQQGVLAGCYSPGKIFVDESLFGGLKNYFCKEGKYINDDEGETVNLCINGEFSQQTVNDVRIVSPESKITEAFSMPFNDSDVLARLNAYRVTKGWSEITDGNDIALFSGIASRIGRAVYAKYKTEGTPGYVEKIKGVTTKDGFDTCKAYAFPYDDATSTIRCTENKSKTSITQITYKRYEVFITDLQ